MKHRIIPECFNKEQLLRSPHNKMKIGGIVNGFLDTTETTICAETDWKTLRGTNICWKTDLRVNFMI